MAFNKRFILLVSLNHLILAQQGDYANIHSHHVYTSNKRKNHFYDRLIEVFKRRPKQKNDKAAFPNPMLHIQIRNFKNWLRDNISREVAFILEDYSKQLYVSSVSVAELLQLHRIKKIKPKQYKTSQELQAAIEKDFYIEILPFTKEYTIILSTLHISDRNNYPFDHCIA